MQFSGRIKNILFHPQKEWAIIGNETYTWVDLLLKYALILAFIPFFFLFLRFAFVGYGLPFRNDIEGSLVVGILHGLNYLLASQIAIVLSSVYIWFLSGSFDVKLNVDKALKLVVFSFTPLFLCGIFLVIPGLSFLNILSIYGIVIFYYGCKSCIHFTGKQFIPFFYFSIAGVFCICLFVFVVLNQVINKETSQMFGFCY